MARLIAVAVCLLVVVCGSLAQDFYDSPFSSGSPRDPRANRGKAFAASGPVTFPVTQPGSETSGVRVGASGYGFVPPRTRGGIGSHGSGPSYFPEYTFW